MGTNITGIGNANAIGFKSRVTGGMYFPPELKDALVGVWSAYGKSNDSTDRNIIKNKIKDRGGDFELINFNYEGTSGYNGYPVIFGKDKTYQYINHSPNYNQTTINVTHFNTRQALLYSYVQQNGELTSYNRDYPSYKIKVSGLEESFGLMYQYNSKANATSVSALRIEANGIYTIPKSYASDGSLTNANIWVGFVFTGTEQEQCNVTIEVLPEYKGAVVTDGVDDMIVSQNTIEEMGITDKFTVVSMIHQITLRGATAAALTNYIRQPIGHEYVRNHVANIGKTGIYGYAVYDVNHSSAGNSHIINTILGDKNDYSIHITGNLSQGKFSVQGYINGDNNAVELSQVAWYWTFIANKLLTEDEINLIIEKYNLDRPGEIVKPDVYYDIKRQKITNENHSSFDDELTDFSGNGHNMKLYNIAWEGNSGIGNYPVIFGANKTWEYMPTYNFIYSNSGSKIHITKVLHAGNGMLFSYAKINDVLQNIKEIPSFKVKVSGLEGNSTLRYSYIKTEDAKYQTLFDLNNGVHEVPKSLVPTDAVVNNTWIGFTIMPIYEEVREFDCDITIEVIPSDENTICLDGVDDYGKVTGLPIYKDYTVAALRKWLYDSVTSTQTGSIVSKSKFGSDGAFIFEQTLNKNPSRSSTWCFGLTNSLINNDKLFEESFTYQTKYSYNNNPIQPGTGFDRDSMWLGSLRDNDSRYSKMAIWSLLLFPYSLSEFLLERQIKKARAGTLYPNQVEFRPIIPEDENITRIDYFVVNSGTWIVIKPGDYVDVGARIVFNVYTKLPYKVEKVSSPAFTGMSVRHSTELNIFDVEGYIKDKTPQKIKLTLAVNEDIVQWNPTITSNLLDSFTASSWYLNGWDNTLTEGTWIKKTDRVFFKATFKTELYGLETATFGGAECVVSKADNWSDSTNIWDIRMLGTVGDLSQVFNLDVYELIRFEDIVQPFPTVFRLLDTTNNHEYTYGDKLKVGSKVKFASFSNLLPELYQPNGTGQYNGVTCVSGTVITVEKQMVFSWSASFTYLKTNAPKCIFSPSKLRMPNESYRYLGYIPDISGNGNNGVFNNFAFSKMSGVNGYLEDFTTLRDYGIKGIVRTDSKIYLDESFDYDKGFWLGYTNVPSPAYKVKISGIPETGMLTYTGGVWLNLTNGINELPARTNTAENHGFVVQSPNLDWSNLVIEQIPEYEGSICFDGVDDYITIPTLSEGGKQVLMKVNWQKQDTMLYNQNPGQDNFAIFTNDYNNNNLVVAYASRNNGNTYIDGVVNNNILATQLKGITHNIVATNNNIDATITPIIGSNKNHDNFFAQMALYDFMLFDEISTDEEIKELNNIVGIEGDYVQKPSYYWDAYGKTNTDADRDEIVNLASDEVSIQYPTDFTDTSVWEDMGAVTSSTILTLTTWAMGGDTGIGNTIKAKVATPAMKVKFITDGNGYLDYMYSGYNTLELPRDAGEYEVELPASTIVDGWGARFSGSGNGSFTIELLGNEVRLGTLKVINSAYDEDSGYGGAGLIVKFSKDYHDNGFWKFVENRSEFNVLNNGDSVNIINAKSVEALFYMAPTTKKAFYKVTGVSTGKGIKFGTDNVSPWEGVIAEKDGIYEVDWSLNVHTGTGDLLAPCILSNGWLGDCNIVIEQVKQYPNGIALDGVDDSLVNTDIPTFTDFTVIAKRTWLEENTSDKPFIIKGDTLYPDGNQNAFLFEYGKLSTYSFGQNNKYDESVVPSLISWATPTSYNGTTSLVRGSAIDTIGIDIAHATKMVFYKLFLYPRTIDMLSINMVKNMMEEDGIIDLTSKLFTDKYTGDFYEMDFNNDFFIGD